MNGNGDAPIVTFTINGREVQAPKGRILIDVAEEIGIYVPRFCYHPGLKSVAVCRMCLVKVEGAKKLLPACATPVDDGMKVDTVDAEAVDAQEGMLEFLLINHPLDCPICDRGGECPLQDQTYRHGPGSSRYIEPKRSFEKPLEISELVVLDRERCVLCWRCVRFSDEIAGDQFIQLVDRGPGTQILSFTDEPFDSYFSGNTIQICPVGALLSKPYRFVARPWDLTTAPSICGYCAVGCPLSNDARAGKLVRCQALPNENVNDFWICDKGRFAYHYVDSEDRLTTPLVRSGDAFESATWGQAHDRIAQGLKDATTVGVIAGGHLTTEDAYAIFKLAREVLKTNDIDSRIQDAGAPYELAAELGVVGSTATMNDIESAQSLVWVGPDPKETLPVLYLRLRKAVFDNNAELTVVSPRAISLDEFATRVIRSDAAGEADAIRSLGASDEASGASVVCWGPAWPGRDETAVFRAALDLARGRSAKVLMCPPHAGSQGMIDMGVHPALGPGYRLADEPGRDTRAILEAAANDELDALLIFGADLIADFPDADLARRALAGKTFTVVVELFPTETVQHADVVLPSAAYAERRGTFTNLERRIQKLEPLLPPPGAAAEPWKAAAEIARALGHDWGWSTWDELWAELRRTVPSHADIDPDALDQPTPVAIQYESAFGQHRSSDTVAGPGGGYPKGFRSGAPFQTGYNWPLSWELRAFEAKQRPGLIPGVSGDAPGESSPPSRSSQGAQPAAATPAAEASSGDASSSASSPEAHAATPPAEASSGDASSSAPSPAAEASSGDASSSASSAEAAEPAAATPAAEADFVLYAGRMIYDRGSMVSRTTALHAIAKKPFVEMNADDARRLGVGDGDEVVLSADGHEARVPVVIADITPGAVFVPYDQEGLRASDLIRGVNPSVKVTRR